MANATPTLPKVAPPAPTASEVAPAPKKKGGRKKGSVTKVNNKIVIDLGNESIKAAVQDQGGAAYVKDLISKDLFSRNLLVYNPPQA